MTRQLTEQSLVQLISNKHELGGAIYITQTDINGQPLNFKINGKSATSGYWDKGLTIRKISWVMIFFKSNDKFNQVWLGDHVKSEKKSTGQYVFHLHNLRGPVNIEKTFKEFTGKREPENPIYFDPQKNNTIENNIARDICDIVDSNVPKSTERQQLILARLGQGKFRQNVLKQWSDSCAVTRCTITNAIRASHIRPWKFSNSTQKLDPNNGIPLLATLDALFDKGLITFTNKGEMRISPKLPEGQYSKLGIPANLHRIPNKQECNYLKYHRENVFKQ